MKNELLYALIGVVVLANISLPTWAGEWRQAAGGHFDNARGAGEITEQKAIAIAKQHFMGRVLAIQLSGHIYRIKILSPQGTLHTVLIDAANGSLVVNH